MLFIAHTAVALPATTFIWVCLKWLKLSSPNKTAFSSKKLMWKRDSSSSKCPAMVSLSKIAPQPELDTSMFNKKLQFEICIGLTESSILSIYHEMFIFPACETSILLSKFSFANLSVRILSRFNDLQCNGPKCSAGKLLVNLPSSLAIYLLTRNSSWSTLWHNCFM